jgi:anti-sigma B factor antagonist
VCVTSIVDTIMNDRLAGSRPPLRIEGEMTIYRAAELCATLRCALAEAADLDVDLEFVTEIDSAGVQLLIAAKAAAAARGHRVRLFGPSVQVIETLRLLGLSDLLGDGGDFQGAQQ